LSVHVVVVNWNGRDTTLECLENLRASLPEDAVVHVVDNGSTDGSVDAVCQAHPWALVHPNTSNLGFAAGANVGIRAALEDGAEWVFLHNNDAVLEPGTVPALLGAAGRHPGAGLFGGRIYHQRSTDVLWCCGVRMGWAPNLAHLRGHQRRGAGRYLEEEEVGSLTGCGLLVHKDVWERIGVLDEAWFVYVEDADFCERARKAGFRCVYVPDAVMEHSGAGSTGGGYSPGRKYLTGYGSVLFLKRHGTFKLWSSFLVFDVLLWPALVVVSILRGRVSSALAKGRGIVHGLIGRPADRGVVER
jgi:GT2 family glycosyltransferase